MSSIIKRYEIEAEEKWQELIEQIPFIKFPTDWQVRVIPPFGGAVARFQVKLPNGEQKSIYLDWYNKLGYMDGPYWEVYPVEGDTGRCDVNDIAELLKLIALPREADKAGESR